MIVCVRDFSFVIVCLFVCVPKLYAEAVQEQVAYIVRSEAMLGVPRRQTLKCCHTFDPWTILMKPNFETLPFR